MFSNFSLHVLVFFHFLEKMQHHANRRKEKRENSPHPEEWKEGGAKVSWCSKLLKISIVLEVSTLLMSQPTKNSNYNYNNIFHCDFKFYCSKKVGGTILRSYKQ